MSGRPLLGVAMRAAARRQAYSIQPSRCLHAHPGACPALQLRKQQPKTSIPFQARRAFAKDSTHTIRGNARILFRNYPFSMSLAVCMIALGTVYLGYVNYYYQNFIIAPYTSFPEEVAKKLRKAVFYSTQDVNPREAVKYYKQAIQVADEIGMDPFSDEVMGIKIRVAELMEKIGQLPRAASVLEQIRDDNLKWLKVYEEQKMEMDKDTAMRKKRTRILAKTVGLSVKLGDHYANAQIWDRDMALERLIWAVETVELEKRRRQSVKATDENDGPWITTEEQAAALEALAHGYEDKSQHYLATPLFLQALTLKEGTDCHSVVLMNNLASSIAQQSPLAARRVAAALAANDITAADAPVGPAATRQTMIENATLWAQKALNVAANITPPVRDEECDMGCAVAMHNLGEFAEMLHDMDTAKSKYREAISLSRAIGFEEGVENSSARLRALTGAG